MALDFTALEVELTRDETVNGGAKTLIERLAAEVEQNKNDPAALQALVNRLRTNNDSLAAAIAAVPPVEPPVEPPAPTERNR